jgi:hypothetical protein
MSTIASFSTSSSPSPSSAPPLGTATLPIANIARNALDSFVPATPPFLVGEQEDLTVKMLETGQRSLRLGKLEEARTTFEATLEQVDLDEVLTAECYLGIALTFPVDSDERSSYIEAAEVEIDSLYEARSDWSRDEEKVFYRNCLTLYQKLLAISKIEAKEGLTLKIENCEKRLFKTPQEKSSEADALYKNKQNDEARVLYREALRDLENEEGCLEWMIAHCTLGIALTLPEDLKWRSKAIEEVNKCYETFQRDFEQQIVFYQLLCSFYYDLLSLIPDFETRKEINWRFIECQSKILSLDQRPSPSNSNKSHKKVALNPGNTETIGTIIFARTMHF